MNVQSPTDRSFQSIPFPVRSFGGLLVCRYMIFSSPKEHVEVEAETAAEALKKSGCKEAYRIVRYMPEREVLIDTANMLSNMSNPAAALAAADVPSATAEATPVDTHDAA